MATTDLNKFDQTLIYKLDPPLPAWRWVGKLSGPDIPGVNWDDLIIETITLPNGETLSPLNIFGSGRTRYYPDFPEVSAITVGFYETETGAANLSLTKWQEAVKSNDGWYGLPKDYKSELKINQFGYSSNVQAVMAYTAEGVWPSDPGSIDLNYTNDDRIILNVTLACDRIIKSPRTVNA